MAAKIQIGKSNGPLSLKAQIEAAGVGMSRDASGNAVISIKFPGVDALDFSRESLRRTVETIDRPRIEGDDPGAVFARSATENPDGSLTSKFSDAPRSRSVTFTDTDRDEVTELFESFLAKWDDFEKMLTEAEAEESKTTEG